MSEKLDATYKLTKIICLIIGVLTLASTTLAGVAVGHYRIESLTQAVEEANNERIQLREHIHALDRSLSSIQTDVRWIRETLEEGKKNGFNTSSTR